ncbi:MAG: T9SS type A sorting domain-containing protein [Bacteroidales bacterium]|nr:T9SS type A sorting domain-containing protein [Bacteroidales bacterium]
MTGAGTYDYGQTASLTATAETGYVFANWTENGTQVSTNTNYSFTVTENRTLIANFEIQTFNISASSNPSNGGTITGTGTYDYGATASLTATAETNYDFVNWTENGTQVSANANYSFTVTDNRTLVANFDETISVNQLERNSFQIYPNPTSANLYVKSNLFTEYNSKAYKLYLIDYLGREFKINYNREVSDVIQIDMNSFGSGVYYLKIMNNNKLIGSFEIIKID